MSGGLLKVVDEMVFGIEFWIPFFEETRSRVDLLTGRYHATTPHCGAIPFVPL